MKKPLIIVVVCGIATVVGVVICLKHNKNSEEKNSQPDAKETEEKTKISYAGLNEQKSNIASTILERHTVAAQIMKTTLSEENNEVGENKHKVDFDEIDSSLDSLLNKE